MDVPDPPVLQVTVDESTDCATVRPSGELDVLSAEELRGHLLLAADTHDRLVLDLSGVSFMDSAGLGVLVSAHRAVTERGGTLVVSGARGMVRQVITASRLDALLTLADDGER